jgi:hypothetical protein
MKLAHTRQTSIMEHTDGFKLGLDTVLQAGDGAECRGEFTLDTLDSRGNILLLETEAKRSGDRLEKAGSSALNSVDGAADGAERVSKSTLNGALNTLDSRSNILLLEAKAKGASDRLEKAGSSALNSVDGAADGAERVGKDALDSTLDTLDSRSNILLLQAKAKGASNRLEKAGSSALNSVDGAADGAERVGKNALDSTLNTLDSRANILLLEAKAQRSSNRLEKAGSSALNRVNGTTDSTERVGKNALDGTLDTLDSRSDILLLEAEAKRSSDGLDKALDGGSNTVNCLANIDGDGHGKSLRGEANGHGEAEELHDAKLYVVVKQVINEVYS